MHRVGTMGFSYPDWVGTFYPRGIKPGEQLAHYARHFNTLELDTTYHALPPPERFVRWASAVPASFRFVPKTYRGVTHDSAPHDAMPAMIDFLRHVEHLGDRLGPVLIQYPPALSADAMGAVREFLGGLPRSFRFVVEFRHASWFRRDAAEMLRDLGIAWACADYVHSPRHLVSTADFVYLRFIGEHDRFASEDRKQIDLGESLRWWQERVAGMKSPPTEIFAMFNNDFEGFSPDSARAWLGLHGIEAGPWVPSLFSP